MLLFRANSENKNLVWCVSQKKKKKHHSCLQISATVLDQFFESRKLILFDKLKALSINKRK